MIPFGPVQGACPVVLRLYQAADVVGVLMPLTMTDSS